MAALDGDAVEVGNGVLPAGIIPPVVTPPTAGGIIHNPENDPPEDIVKTKFYVATLVGHGKRLLADALGGDCVELFDQFWFNHLHILPQRFDLGNVLATSVRDYEIYNGFFVSKTVNNIIDTGFDGIAITSGPDTPPFPIGPKSSEFFEVTVSTIGPPQIDAEKEYQFVSGETLSLFITGTRIVVFPLPPTTPINEIYSFKTDVQIALDGTEQRTRLRDIPRLIYAFPYRQIEEVMAFSENQFYEWMQRLWAMPQWVDWTTSTSDVSTPAINIPVVSTADRDFRAGAGELGVIFENFENFEAFEIAAVNANSLDLSVPLNGSFPEGSAVMPVRFAFMRGPLTTRPWVIKLRDMDIEFDVLEGIDYNNDFADLATTYKSLPVFLDLLGLDGLQYNRTFDKRITRNDSEIGLFDQFNTQDYLVAQEGAKFELDGRAEIARMKRILHSFRGRQKTVWMPTYRDDMRIADGQDLLAGQNLIRIRIANYDIFLDDNKRTREDIIVFWLDGTFQINEIQSATLVPGSHEELVMLDNWAQDVSQANVAMISFLVRRRLTVDDLKFSWTLNEDAEISVSFVDVLA